MSPPYCPNGTFVGIPSILDTPGVEFNPASPNTINPPHCPLVVNGVEPSNGSASKVNIIGASAVPSANICAPFATHKYDDSSP